MRLFFNLQSAKDLACKFLLKGNQQRLNCDPHHRISYCQQLKRVQIIALVARILFLFARKKDFYNISVPVKG